MALSDIKAKSEKKATASIFEQGSPSLIEKLYKTRQFNGLPEGIKNALSEIYEE